MSTPTYLKLSAVTIGVILGRLSVLVPSLSDYVGLIMLTIMVEVNELAEGIVILLISFGIKASMLGPFSFSSKEFGEIEIMMRSVGGQPIFSHPDDF